MNNLRAHYYGFVMQNFTTGENFELEILNHPIEFTSIEDAIFYGKELIKNDERFTKPSEEHFRLYVAKFGYKDDISFFVAEEEIIELFRTRTNYKIKHGNGFVSGKNGHYSFDSFEQARKEAVDFKANPKDKNPNMTDENENYWKNEKYIITKEYTITTELEII